MTAVQRPEAVAVVVLGGINMDLVSMTPRFPQAGESVVGSRFLTYPGVEPLEAWMIRS